MKNYFFVFVLILSTVAAAQSQKSELPLPDSGDVTLPLDQYNKLLELASKPTKQPEAPPQNYSIQCAELKFQVENESVLGSVHLEGEIFKKGVIKVPLVRNIITLDAQQDGKGVPLEQENGTQIAVLNGPSDFAVTLSAALPLRIEAGRASFTLPVPAAGSAQLTLVVPGEHTSVNISPGLILNRTSENGSTTIEATLAPGQPVSIWWATRETTTQMVPKEIRFLSDVKTLLSVSEAELRVAALADITVVQGEPTEFAVKVPVDYEVTGVTGASLESSEVLDGALTLKVIAPGQRHQFLISMERSISDSKAGAPFISFENAQRETGEVLVEGAGTMELTAHEGGGLQRIDVKETSYYLRSLAHYPPQAAFRFHRQPNEEPTLALEWTRFPDSSVLAAVADSAAVTTLVTSEGKTLTEIKLTVKNQAQPFLKVTLPSGASILSADVAGERVKPVQGPDGSRVPLLRPGFHPNGPYEVSFVFMHSGAPFAKKGGSELSLPSMDLPITLLHWELFLPDRYQVKDFGGDVISAALLSASVSDEGMIGGTLTGTGGGVGGGMGSGTATGSPLALHGYAFDRFNGAPLFPGQIGGVVVDPSGAAISGATVTVTNTANGASMNAVSDSAGHWVVSNFPSGQGKLRVDANGFHTLVQTFDYNNSRPAQYMSTLQIGSASETVEVTAQAVAVDSRSIAQLEKLETGAKKQAPNTASANVLNLQRRVAGVLPVAMDVPRTGTSFEFARALVLDEETRVTFSYKSR
jgi:Carboxypeptidase regulatory-like domain